MEVAPTFEGLNGVLKYADGRFVQCRYRLWADELRGPRLECVHDKPDWVFSEAASNGHGPRSFEAVQSDGYQLSLEGVFLQTSDDDESEPESGQVLVTYLCNGPGLRRFSDETAGPLSVRFRLVNFRFSGDATTHTLPAGGFRISRDTLKATLGGRPIRLVQLEGYRSIVRRLTAGDLDAAVTCEAACSVDTKTDLTGLEEWMDRVCAALSFAAGTKVTWTTYEVRNAEGILVGAVRRAPVIKKFSAAALIDLNDVASLSVLIESAFRKVVDPAATVDLRRLIDAKIDTQTGGFLETRTLMASVLAEYLVKSFSATRRYSARSFEEHARFVVREFQIPFRGKDLDKLVGSRNSLVHELRFKTGERHREYLRLAHFVDCLLLRLIGYSGAYFNREARTLDTLPAIVAHT